MADFLIRPRNRTLDELTHPRDPETDPLFEIITEGRGRTFEEMDRTIEIIDSVIAVIQRFHSPAGSPPSHEELRQLNAAFGID